MTVPYSQIISREGHEPCPGVRFLPDLPVRSLDGWEQTVSVFQPESVPAAPAPALVYFHGGGFTNGHPNSVGRVGKTLALVHGMTTFSFNYHLGTPQNPSYPKPLDDLAFAWSWVRERCAEWNVDPDRIAVGGSSAGCALAALALTTGRFPGAAALLAYWGPLDFIARWYDRGQSSGAESNLLGQTYEQNPVAYHQASALTHVHPGLPPALFIYGRQDTTVHPHQGELGLAAWRAVGSDAELHVYNYIGHGEGCGSQPEEIRKYLEETCRFTGRVLAGTDA